MAKSEQNPSAAQIEPAALAPRRGLPRGSARYGRMNTGVAALLVALVLISAVPVASNRPSWWLLWTLVIGVVGAVYVARAQYLMAGRRRLQSAQMAGFFALAMIVPIYAVVQSLPLAALLPAAWLGLPADLPAAIHPASISVMPDASWLGAIRAGGLILFLMLTLEVATQPTRVHRMGLWLMGGILAHGIFGLVALKFLDDYSLWGDKQAYLGMLTGTFVNRNSMATFLGFGLILALAFALERGALAARLPRDRGYAVLLTPARVEGAALWLAVAVLAIAIILTQSRMGLFSTLVGAMVTLLAMRIVSGARRSQIAVQSALGLAVIGVFLIPLAGGGVIERALFAFSDGGERLAIYQQTWQMIMDRPLTGFGYDAFAPAYELYRAAPVVSASYVDLAHNSYLALWSEQGLLIGSIPILLILWAVARITLRLRRGLGDAAVNTAALGVAVLGALHSLLDFSLEIPANTFCFVLILGLAMAPERQNPDKAA